jgi:RimJ/RimL family protein N-acetyltransferase
MDTFTTARLIAERLSPEHLPDLVALHLDPEVSRYLGGVRSPEATKGYLAVNMAHWGRLGLGLWVWRTRGGAFVGRGGIRPLTVGGVDEMEVAYALSREFWGRGYASEMTEAMAELGLARQGVSSLVGVVFAQNLGSRRVLEKAGFTLEGPVVHGGVDCVLYRRAGSGTTSAHPGKVSPP